MQFEWDEAKEKSNIAKHGLDFTQAIAAFADPCRILEVTQGRGGGSEPRYRCIGFDGNGVATVNFTMRKANIRIINAGYWRKGKRDYEKNKIHG